MIANKYCISTGVGYSSKGLPSFDRALIEAGVGNYNLVKLSSILPAHAEWVPVKDVPNYLKEGSLLPTAYSTISSDKEGDVLVSTIGVGLPADESKVGVIMEYSVKNVSETEALNTLNEMIDEAFEVRGWNLSKKVCRAVSASVKTEGEKCTTFACIAEW